MAKFFGQILPSSSFLISIALIYLHLDKGEDKDKDKAEDKDKGWQRDEREISYIANLVDPPAGNLNRCQTLSHKKTSFLLHQYSGVVKIYLGSFIQRIFSDTTSATSTMKTQQLT